MTGINDVNRYPHLAPTSSLRLPDIIRTMETRATGAPSLSKLANGCGPNANLGIEVLASPRVHSLRAAALQPVMKV